MDRQVNKVLHIYCLDMCHFLHGTGLTLLFLLLLCCLLLLSGIVVGVGLLQGMFS